MNTVGSSSRTAIASRIAAVVERQGGIIDYHQLLDCGLSPGGVASRVRRGDLFRVQPRVYAKGHRALSRTGLMFAALRAVGGDAAIGGRTALEVLGIWRFRAGSEIEVVVQKRVRCHAGIRVRQTRQLDDRDICDVDGMRVTTVARALIDLSMDLDPRELANVMHEARFRKRLNIRELQRLIKRFRTSNGHPNIVVALELHLSGSAGHDSQLEARFHALIADLPIPDPIVNTPLQVDGGPRIRVDAFWPDARVCVEVDGPVHCLPRTQREDAAKAIRLDAAGFRLLRFWWWEIEQNPAAVRARLLEMLDADPT